MKRNAAENQEGLRARIPHQKWEGGLKCERRVRKQGYDDGIAGEIMRKDWKPRKVIYLEDESKGRAALPHGATELVKNSQV